MSWKCWTLGCLLLLSPLARARPPWVVLVGVDDYVQEGIPDLRYAGADAKLLMQAARQVLDVPAEQIFCFTSDATDSQLTPRVTNIVYRLDQLRASCKPDDTLLIYFAGHGVTVEGESFLLTEESDNRSLATLKNSALSARELQRLMKSNKAGHTLMMLDACRNDPRGQRTGSSLDAGFSASLSDTASNQESASLFSCSVGEKSWEWPEKQHGFFTYFLVEGLRQGAAQADGQVTLDSLFHFVAERVPERTKAVVASPQQPVLRYEGRSLKAWQLARVAPGKAARLPAGGQGLAQLDAEQARQDVAAQQKALLEARLRQEEGKRKELEQRLQALDKSLPANSSEEVQKLVLSRDLALKELLEARQQLEVARKQLASRSSGSNLELELIQAEKEQLKAENKVLLTRINLLEEKLSQSGVSFARALPASPSDTLDDQLAYSQRTLQHAEELLQLAQKKLQIKTAEILQVDEEAVALQRRLTELENAYIEKLRNRVQEAELRAGLWDSRSILNEDQWSRLDSLVKALERLQSDHQQLQRRYAQQVEDMKRMAAEPRFRSRFISRRFYQINRLPGLGDILDVPIKSGPEAQEL